LLVKLCDSCLQRLECEVKVKEVDLYSAFIVVPHTQGAEVRITQCYLQITPYVLPLPRKHAFTRWRIPGLRLRTSNCSLLLIYLPRKDERLSRPDWLTYSGRFTHISGHPSAAGRAQDSESSPVRNRRSATQTTCRKSDIQIHLPAYQVSFLYPQRLQRHAC